MIEWNLHVGLGLGTVNTGKTSQWVWRTPTWGVATVCRLEGIASTMLHASIKRGYNRSVRLTLSWLRLVTEKARSCVVAVSRLSGFPFSPHKLGNAFEKKNLHTPPFILVSVEINRLCTNVCIILVICRWEKNKLDHRELAKHIKSKASENHINATVMMVQHSQGYSFDVHFVVTWKRRIILEEKGEMVEKLVFWWHDPFSWAHN